MGRIVFGYLCALAVVLLQALAPAFAQEDEEFRVVVTTTDSFLGQVPIQGLTLMFDDEVGLSITYVDNAMTDAEHLAEACFRISGREDVCDAVEMPRRLTFSNTVQHISVYPDGGFGSYRPSDSDRERVEWHTFTFEYFGNDGECLGMLRLIDRSRIDYDPEVECWSDYD